jgi:hypothetical protein
MLFSERCKRERKVDKLTHGRVGGSLGFNEVGKCKKIASFATKMFGFERMPSVRVSYRSFSLAAAAATHYDTLV